MEKETKVDVTLYDATFKGVFGRNRTPKFEIPAKREVAPDFVPDAAFLQGLLDDAVRILKPKTGKFYIRRTEGCSRTTYEDTETGRKSGAFTFPLYASTTLSVIEYRDGSVVPVVA